MISLEDRCEFGIQGLDSALCGGIPRNNLVLLSGGAGTGKSTLALHFLVSGVNAGEKGLYVSTEQSQTELIKQASKYSIDLDALIKKNLVKIIFVDVLRETSLLEKIRNEVKAFSPSRIIVDSLSTFSEFVSASDFSRDILLKRGGVAIRTIDQVVPPRISERTMTKRMLGMLIATLRGLSATVLMTSELPESGELLSSDGISEFLADGVIVLHHLGVGLSQFRNLQIRKMRYSKHSNEVFGYDFGDKGIVFVENAV